MKPALRLFLILFAILCSTTISGASIQETHSGVVFEKACVHEGKVGFRADFNAPKRTGNGIITPDGISDHAANILGGRFGGQASVRLKGFGNREFDFVSSKYVGQTFGGNNFALKPKNFLSKSRRNQIRQTMKAGKAHGRRPLFNFEGGTAHKDVLDFISRNAERSGVNPIITNFAP